MKKKPLLSPGDLRALLVTAAAFFSFFSVYAAYSIVRYNALDTRSLVSAHVVMRIIQHDVRCVCPKCAAKGTPMCPRCSVEMFWNGYRGAFICPSCGEGGFPSCGHCGSPMTWIEMK
jgi:hypothetical protein